MKSIKLWIGKIPYANLFPFFYYLEKKCDISEYRFIKGHPSRLNKMLREGIIDISPSSSIEYLKNKKKYSILPFLSISSEGRIESILLFSKYPLNELNGKTIAVSSDSETSAVLLKILLKEFNRVNCKFKKINCRGIKNPLSTYSAVLLIGDTAMREAKKAVASCKLQVASKNRIFKLQTINSKLRTPNSSLYIYDLGELWHKYTGLPFVFALWIVRRDSLSQKKELIKKFSEDLNKAKRYASQKLSLIAKEAPQKEWFTEKGLLNYWKGISYDFTEEHIKGLQLFEKYTLSH